MSITNRLKHKSTPSILSTNFFRGRKIVAFFIACMFLSLNSSSQTLTATLDREKMLLGEQVSLQLKLEDFNDRTSYLKSWIQLPDTSNHIEFLKSSAIDTVVVTGFTNYIQTVAVTSFDSGTWTFPAIQVTIQDKETGKQTTLKAASLTLEVLPVDVSNMKAYHPIKDIIEVEVPNNTWITITIALIALISLIALWYLLRKRKAIIATKKPVIKGSLLEWAIHEIELLQKEDLPAKNQEKQFYTRLDEIYRTYFDEQLNVSKAYLTGDEMMVRLKVYLQQENVRTQFYQLVRLVNAVKFAKYLPSSTQNDDAIITAKNTIQHIDHATQQVKKNNAY